MIKLKCYKSPMGLYVQTGQYESWHNYYKFNGKSLEDTHSKVWKLLEGESELTSILKTVSMPGQVCSYSLIDPNLASDKIPATLTIAEVGREYDDDEDCYVWANYSTLRSLYKEEYSEATVSQEEQEFEVEYLGSLSVEDLEAPHKAAISILKPSSVWANTKVATTTVSSLAEYEEIVKAVVPDLLIHTQPCIIPSPVAYQIVRGFIKDNIDKKEAMITSDYDFCFTVKKKVAIKPIVWKSEIKTARDSSYRPPRYKTGTTAFKELEIFEMTDTKQNYRGYTPIAGFAGSNLKELVANVQTYLEELISYINTPFKQCEHCDGVGRIIGEKFKMNLRE